MQQLAAMQLAEDFEDAGNLAANHGFRPGTVAGLL
jgi:hypothetical protein